MTFTCKWSGSAVSENLRVQPGNGRWKASGVYGVFLKELVYTLIAERVRQRWRMVFGRTEVRLDITCPGGMDHHNLIKPCLDALQRAGIIENDRDCWDVRAVRVGVGKVSEIAFKVEEVT